MGRPARRARPAATELFRHAGKTDAKNAAAYADAEDILALPDPTTAGASVTNPADALAAVELVRANTARSPTWPMKSP